MKIDTKYFGEIEIADEKIIHFDSGILGFEDYKDYTMIHDIDKDDKSFFWWLQSVDEKALAFPIVNPLKVDENYKPHVNDEVLKPLGSYSDEDLAIFLLATIPVDVKETSVNMRAPLIVNSSTRKAIQIILDSPEYEIKHKLIKQQQ